MDIQRTGQQEPLPHVLRAVLVGGGALRSDQRLKWVGAGESVLQGPSQQLEFTLSPAQIPASGSTLELMVFVTDQAGKANDEEPIVITLTCTLNEPSPPRPVR